MDKKEQEALELAINLILEAADELQTIKMIEQEEEKNGEVFKA